MEGFPCALARVNEIASSLECDTEPVRKTVSSCDTQIGVFQAVTGLVLLQRVLSLSVIAHRGRVFVLGVEINEGPSAVQFGGVKVEVEQGGLRKRGARGRPKTDPITPQVGTAVSDAICESVVR